MDRRKWTDCLEWRETNARHAPTTQPLEGRSVCILGGGPSLTRDIAQTLIETSPCIAVNDSYKLLPEPGVVVAIDRRWWNWHGNHVRAAKHMGVTAVQGNGHPPFGFVGAVLDRNRLGYVPEHNGQLCGLNSGQAAITLAGCLGASTVYLAGFDMGFDAGGSTHWHGGHRIPSSEGNYERRFRPALEECVRRMGKARGVSISAITRTFADIPITPFEQALDQLRGDHADSMDNA